ncbi:TPA: hypothetical protein I3599_000532 [Enterobacter cloacae]|nr:hypothetical protein [Enterobacter cloacae]
MTTKQNTKALANTARSCASMANSVSGTIKSIVLRWNQACQASKMEGFTTEARYTRRAMLAADMLRMAEQLDHLAEGRHPITGQTVDEAHAEALEMNAETDRRRKLSVMRTIQNEIMEKPYLPALVEACHAEALEENKRFDWLHNRWCLFHSSSRLQQEEIIGVAWEQARQIIEADEVDNFQRQRKLEAIWKHTHRDYKGETDGIRSILVCRNGTISVPLENLTEAEIEQRSYLWQRDK